VRLFRAALWCAPALLVPLLLAFSESHALREAGEAGDDPGPARAAHADTWIPAPASSAFAPPSFPSPFPSANGVARALGLGVGLGVAAVPGGGSAARPTIVPRRRWQAGQSFAQPPARYADKVVAVFIHHTDTPKGYDCADAPRTIRNLYVGQAGTRDWDDIGYNFLVDTCGTIYEGRAGGADRPVVGAHTQGFNHRTTGIAAIGTFTAGTPVPKAMTAAIAALTAWKLGLAGVDPRGRARLVSTHGLSRYQEGTAADFHVVAGHKDGYMTDCPGAALTAALPAIRATAAYLQGRGPWPTPR
jgi:hypothetical protein